MRFTFLSVVLFAVIAGCGLPPCQPGSIPDSKNSHWCHVPDAVTASDASTAASATSESSDAAIDAGVGSSGSQESAAGSGASAADGGVMHVAGAGRGGMTGSAAAAGISGMPATGGVPAGAPPPRCGDGHLDHGELCDGNCPTQASCTSTNACLIATLTGDPSMCDSRCELASVKTCASGDGCCAPGCNYGTDTDCSKSCGDGVVTAPETCEPTSKAQPCPTSCDDGNACTSDTLSGTPAQCNVVCNHMAITAAISGDSCCPSGANATTDSDCKPSCGNGVVESGETCDGNCPNSCDDGNACTTDTLAGSATNCTAKCSNQPVTTCMNNDGCCAPGCTNSNDNDCAPPPPRCGDGHVDPGETCDGNCPTSCDDGNVCTTDLITGSAAGCDAKCTSSTITACKSGDGCCAHGCTNSNDNDCPAPPPSCGDGHIDTGEECEIGAASRGTDNLPAGTKYDEWSCDGSTCKRRYIYTPCTSDSQGGITSTPECGPGGSCFRGRCSFVCDSNNANCSFSNGAAGLCFGVCMIRCDGSQLGCPNQLSCDPYTGTTFKICGLNP